MYIKIYETSIYFRKNYGTIPKQWKFLNNYDYRTQICDGKNYGTMEKVGYYSKL